MRPFHAKVFRFVVAAGPLLTRLVHRIVHVKVAGIGIALLISGGQLQRPGAVTVNVAGKRYVYVVVYHYVITEVAQIQAAGILLTKGRHHDTAGTVWHIGYKTKWQRQRQGDILHHKVGRTEHGVLAGLGNDFSRRHLQVIVRMLRVADCIFTAGYVHRLVFQHLELLSAQLTVLLVCHHILDAGLTGIKAVVNLLHLVLRLAIFEHRLPHPVIFVVFCTACVHDIIVKIVGHIVGRNLGLAIFHRDITIVIDNPSSSCKILYDRVFSRRECWPLKGALGAHGNYGRRIRSSQGRIGRGEHQRIGSGKIQRVNCRQ